MSRFLGSVHGITRAPRPGLDETAFRLPATCADGKSDKRRQERRARSNERALLLYRGYALDLALAENQEDSGDAGRDSGGDRRVEDPVAGLLEVLALGGVLDVDGLVGVLKVGLLGDLPAVRIALQALEDNCLLARDVRGLEHHGYVHVEVRDGGGEPYLPVGDDLVGAKLGVVTSRLGLGCRIVALGLVAVIGGYELHLAAAQLRYDVGRILRRARHGERVSPVIVLGELGALRDLDERARSGDVDEGLGELSSGGVGIGALLDAVAGKGRGVLHVGER